MAAARRAQPDRPRRAGPGTAGVGRAARCLRRHLPRPRLSLSFSPFPSCSRIPPAFVRPGSRLPARHSAAAAPAARPGARALALARPPPAGRGPAPARSLVQVPGMRAPPARRPRSAPRLRPQTPEPAAPATPPPSPRARSRPRSARALRSPGRALPEPWARRRSRARGAAGNRGDAGGVGAAACRDPGIHLRRGIFAPSGTSAYSRPPWPQPPRFLGREFLKSFLKGPLTL